MAEANSSSGAKAGVRFLKYLKRKPRARVLIRSLLPHGFTIEIENKWRKSFTTQDDCRCLYKGVLRTQGSLRDRDVRNG